MYQENKHEIFKVILNQKMTAGPTIWVNMNECGTLLSF
jgi:hypothetical protein